MVEFKLVISDPKTSLSVQRELKDKEASAMLGRKIGDAVAGDAIGLAGYELVVTGGSDYCGFPMRKDVSGTGRKKILAVEGVGIKRAGRGIKQRKTVCGNTIHSKIVQVNLKVVKKGAEDLFVKKEGAKEDKPKEAKQEKPAKAEEKKEVKAKEEKPADKK